MKKVCKRIIKKITDTYKNKTAYGVIMLLVIALLVACGNGDNENAENRRYDSIVNSEGSVNSERIDTYLYVPEFIYLPYVSEHIHQSTVHDGRIYFSYVLEAIDENSSAIIVVESILPDGTQASQMKIQTSFADVSVAAINITETGNVALIVMGTTLISETNEVTFLYLEYTPQGTQVISHELTELTTQVSELLFLDKGIFTEEGNIALLGRTRGNNAVIIVFDSHFYLRGQMDVSSDSRISKKRDGGVIVSDREMSGHTTRTVLREIDFDEGDWGDNHYISFTNVWAIYPAHDDDLFDVYIDDGTHIFGYNLATNEWTLIFNWLEVRIGPAFRHHINILDNGQISLLRIHGDFMAVEFTEYVILTRIARESLPEYTVITLGALRLNDGPLDRGIIAAFNRENQYYQIQVVEYFDGEWDDELAWEAARTRFSIDLMAGRIPDILFVEEDMKDALIARGFLADLYYFIDSDPELSRSDFLPNILNAAETPDGILPTISSVFRIVTMIGLPAVTAGIESWTFTDMAEFVEQADDSEVLYLFGEFMTSERFLELALNFSGEDFINKREHIANLDSEEFINLLEVSARLRREDSLATYWDANTMGERISPHTRMLRGEQLLDVVFLDNIAQYQMYTAKLGDDIVAIGFPSQTGGVHLIHFGMFAISASSPNQEAAWDFVRRYLLPTINLDHIFDFPLRIDLFEEKLTQARTPYIIIDEHGNEVESPGLMGAGDFIVPIYALTEAEERALREIIESASIMRRYDETIMNMVREETHRFFAGDRSAAETARILQNRVQRYLDELR